MSQKKYSFKPYRSHYPVLFEKEKERILFNFEMPITIEHIGSTAVPGLGGKGIIDIGIAVDKSKMEIVSHHLQKLGYEFRPTFSTPDRLYFIIYQSNSEETDQRYHIHLTYPQNPEWKNFLHFRDYLRSHPKALEEYSELKRQAVSMADNQGDIYRKIKEPIFRKYKSHE